MKGVFFLVLMLIPTMLFPDTNKDSSEYYFNIGYGNYVNNQFGLAAISFEKFIQAEHQSQHPRYYKLPEVYQMLASCYQKSGNYDKAIQSLTTAAVCALQNGNEDRLALVYNDLGNLWMWKGRYEQSLEYFEYSLRLFKKSRWTKKIIHSYLSLGDCYFHLNDYQKANEYYNSALKMDELAITEPPVDLPIIKNKIGMVSTKIGNFATAKLSLESALNWNRIVLKNEPSRITEIAETLLLLGELYSENNHLDTALNYTHGALKIYDSLGNPDRVAFCHYQAGRFLLKQNNTLLALTELKKGIDLKLRDWQVVDNSVEVFTDLTLLNLLIEKGKCLKYSYQKFATRSFLEQMMDNNNFCLQILDNLKTSTFDFETKLSIGKKEKKIIEDLIWASLKSFEATGNVYYQIEAFKYVERSRFSILLSQIRQSEIILHDNLSDSLAAIDKTMLANINRLKMLKQLSINKLLGGSIIIDSIDNELFKLNRIYENFKTEISDYDIKTLAINFDDIIGISEFQKMITKNQAFIEYHLSSSSLLIFVITSSDFELSVECLGNDLFDRVNETRKELMNPLLNIDSLHENLSDLYNKLIAPIDYLLTSKDELIIVPDNILGFLPFELLILNKPSQKKQHPTIEYLIENKVINYAFSATLYEKILSTKSEKKGMPTFFALAPFSEFDKISITDNSNREIMSRGIECAFLAASKTEVENLLKYFNGQILFGSEATESNFKNNAHNYDILHIASHAVLDIHNPFLSNIIFSSEIKDKTEDGQLFLYELFNMNLDARLVVLSACNTGIGRYFEGEGVVSLASSFFSTKVHNLVMSLWNINDNSTAEIMNIFYRELADGLSPAAALKEAKVEFILNHKNTEITHPYFWAGLVVTGDNSCVVIKKNEFSMSLLIITWLVTILAISVILVFIFSSNR